MTVGTKGAPRKGRAAPLLIVAGLVLLIVVGAAWYLSRPEPTVGAEAVAALESAPAASVVPSATASVVPSATTRKPSENASRPPSARKKSPPPAGKADKDAPARLVIPSLDLDATVAAVGVDARTGDFDVPPSVDRVGWYKFGPGQTARTGSIVIAGHVDSADQGKGAFFKLRGMEPGQRIELTGQDGRDREFKVVGREIYQKTRIPLDKYFARDGAPRLTLITCGGPFDSKTGHYRDNIVVTAEPVS